MTSDNSFQKRCEAAQAEANKHVEASDYPKAIRVLEEIVQDQEFNYIETWFQINLYQWLGSLYERIGDKANAEAAQKKVAEYGKKYLTLLREYPHYDETEVNEQVVFTYQAACDLNLVKVRKEFDLDTVAGEGDEVSRILRLLDWAHKVVRYDGNSESPYPRNSLHLINVCREQNRGVNCRMMAIILNEAYLAMGFRSRFVTCLPLNADDPDCHVVNTVYAPSLGKWLYMDPSFGAYLTDENGNLLSILEVRARLLTGEPLVLNKEVNYNGQPTETDYYLRYISKNLALMTCSKSSEFDLESKPFDGSNYILLAPAGRQLDQRILDRCGIPQESICHNSALFWQAPVRLSRWAESSSPA